MIAQSAIQANVAIGTMTKKQSRKEFDMPNIIKIQDLGIPQLDCYARLSEVQLLRYYEPKEGIFIAESPKVIARALDAGCVPISALVEEKQIEGEAKEVLERCGQIPVFTGTFHFCLTLQVFPLPEECSALCAARPFLPLKKFAGEQSGLRFWKK